MKKGKCLIEGLIVMEGRFRGPEDPRGPMLDMTYALVREIEGRVQTCGKVEFSSPPNYEAWPEKVRTAFQAFVDSLEEEVLRRSNIFENDEERIHVVVPAGPRDSGEPEDF